MRFLLLLLAFSMASSARAATYVDEPSLGHWVLGVGLHGGSTIGGDAPVVPLGVAGFTVSTGYAWESGWSALSTGGFTVRAADDARSAFVGVEGASQRELSLGFAVRLAPFSAMETAPFVEIGAHALRVQAENSATQGGKLSGKLGVRVRLEGFEPWVAAEFEAVALKMGAADRSRSDRIMLAVGIRWPL